MFYIVYKIKNLINEKIYIGCHKTININDDYMGSSKILKKAINKYGIINFKKEILYIFDNSKDMYAKESEIVDEIFIKRKDTYNLKIGGFGGFDYINKNISFKNRGFDYINKNKLNNTKRPHYLSLKIKEDEDYKILFSKKVSEGINKYYKNGGKTSFIGRKHSLETKKKMSESKKEKYKGKNNPSYGSMWIYSLEEKISKKIKKEDFSNWEIKGWLKGRKIIFEK